jgi:hypothetical protein
MNAATPLLWLCWVLLILGYLALGLWVVVCPLLWILRDGLGPDSVETTGWAAVGKFSPVLLTGAGLVVYLAVLHVCAWWLRRRETHLSGRDLPAGVMPGPPESLG